MKDIYLVTTKDPEDWDFMIEARFDCIEEAEKFAKRMILENNKVSNIPIELMLSKYIASFKPETKVQPVQFYNNKLTPQQTIKR